MGEMPVPISRHPLCAGVVTRSKASGKACPAKAGLVCREACSEVSQTAVSVLTNRNHILRP
ncbi:hypothetical protein SAMN04488057_1042 [Cyclobacterium lianum]|uniref:Uncharacterized protein n=1 Tax=Cyclobacterium lianum TaxID=388280 RepID=A0A1M7LYT3_9BACT|nr:hypothetical protein SAMN04488057_1042 [Cyclobacterium lianum]